MSLRCRSRLLELLAEDIGFNRIQKVVRKATELQPGAGKSKFLRRYVAVVRRFQPGSRRLRTSVGVNNPAPVAGASKVDFESW